MKNYKNILLAIFSLLLFSGCSSDLLDLEPQGEKLEANYYTTVEEAYMALTAVYDVTTWSYPWGMSWYCTLASAGDDANAGGESALDRIEYFEPDEFNISVTNDGPLNLWIKYYAGIYRANVIQGIELEGDVIDVYKAEAKFLRAFFYFDLVRFFGDVPIITSVLTPEEYGQTRSPASEVYDLIIQDLQDAIPLLPEKPGEGSSNLGRATKGAAKALLGKVYLFLEMWPEAETQLGEVIDSEIYDLETPYDSIFDLSWEHSTESVIEFNYTDIRGTSWDGPYGYNEGNLDIQLMGIRDLVMDPALPEALDPGWGFVKPTQDLVDVFLAENDSLRLYSNVIFGDSLLAQGATFDDDFGFEGFFRKKYSMKVTDKPTQSQQYAQDYLNMRYADVILMYAEAAYRNNKPGIAVYNINLVRARADLADISPSGTAIFDAIVNERRLELALEGIRYWDVIRWGMADTEFGPLGYDPATKGLWPIPQEEILRTGGTLTQNEGY